MDELRKRLDELKPVVKIDELYEKKLPDVSTMTVASLPGQLAG
jgi:hypothetical protein